MEKLKYYILVTMEKENIFSFKLHLLNYIKYKMKVIIELEGQDKHACIDELLALQYKA